MENYEYKKYKVTEEYLGKKIEVNVQERWSSSEIEEANISCPKYNVIFRTLGSKAERLSIDDVHDAIFKEIFLAEKSICGGLGIQHDNFLKPRSFKVVVDYKGQEIRIGMMLFSSSNRAWITCASGAADKAISMENNAYRYIILDEIRQAKKLIDNGYVFSQSGLFEKVRKRVKKIF